MPTAVDTERPERSRTELVGLAVLGLAYVIAGLGLFYGLAIDSMQVFNAALVAIFVLLAVSVGILIRTEPIVSRENAVISACIFAAMALFFGLSTFTGLPYVVLFGVLLFVGVILPGLILRYRSSIVDESV